MVFVNEEELIVGELFMFYYFVDVVDSGGVVGGGDGIGVDDFELEVGLEEGMYYDVVLEFEYL